MKKEERNVDNFGVQHNFICIFRILYFSYSEYFLYSILAFFIFHILHFSVFCI